MAAATWSAMAWFPCTESELIHWALALVITGWLPRLHVGGGQTGSALPYRLASVLNSWGYPVTTRIPCGASREAMST